MRGENCDWKYLPFIYCAERWGSFVSFDLHLFNYWESVCSSQWDHEVSLLLQKTAAGDPAAGSFIFPDQSCASTEMEEVPWWHALKKQQAVGSWPKVNGPAYPMGSHFLPSHPKGRAGQGTVQALCGLPEPSVYSHPKRQAQLKVNAAHLCTLSLGSAHCPQCTDSTCVGPSSHNLRLVLFWASPAQPRWMDSIPRKKLEMEN